MALFGKSQAVQQPLLLTQIDFTKSMIHAASQSVGHILCDGIGHANSADWDEFIQSEAGKRFVQGIRDGAVHLLSKGMAS